MLVSPYHHGSGLVTSSNRWRLETTATQVAGNTTAFAQIELRAAVGGADQFAGGTASASSEALGSTTAAKAIDGDASTFWSSSSGQAGGILPTWWENLLAAPVGGEELVITGYPSAEANNPKSISLKLWDGANFQNFLSCADIGPFKAGTTKYLRKTLNEIWLKDLLTNHSGGGTSYTDNRATMGVRVLANADTPIEAVTVLHRSAIGGQYQAFLYELNSSNQFVAEIAAGPVSSPAALVAVADRTYSLGGQFTMTSGKRYAKGIRRVDGTNTSNPDCHFFNGLNSYRTASLTIQDIFTLANKSTPAVGTASAITNGSATVWTIAPIIRQAQGTLT